MNRTISLLTLAALLSAGSAVGQVRNDECPSALRVTDGTNGPFSNVGATGSSPSWLCANGGSDVWYVYNASCTGDVTASLCTATADFDTAIQVFSGDCRALISLSCNDDFCSLVSQSTFPATQGTDYYIRVGGFGGAQGNFDLVLSCVGSSRPQNDECGGAVPLALGINGPFSNRNATTSLTASCGSGGGNDVWFSYAPACNSDAVFSLCNGAAANFDTVLAIYIGDCASGLRQVACNDDTCVVVSEVSMPIVANTTYYLKVGSFGGTGTGDFEIDVQAYDPGQGRVDTLRTGCGGDLQFSGIPSQGTQMDFFLTNASGRPSAIWFGNRISLALCPGCVLGADFGILLFVPSVSVLIPCDPTIIGGEICVQGYVSGAGCSGLALSDTYCVTITGG